MSNGASAPTFQDAAAVDDLQTALIAQSFGG
jgi:hypothetical protein